MGENMSYGESSPGEVLMVNNLLASKPFWNLMLRKWVSLTNPGILVISLPFSKETTVCILNIFMVVGLLAALIKHSGVN